MKKICGAIIFCTFFYSYGSERTLSVEPIQVPQSPKNGSIKIKLNNSDNGKEQHRLKKPFTGFSPREGIKESTKK